MIQRSLFKFDVEFGGELNKGKAKTRRPLSTKKPIHYTLRSEKAIGPYSLLKHEKKISAIIEKHAKRNHIRIYENSINSNHIHMALRGKCIKGLQNFFRIIGGLIARAVTGAQKGNPFGKFWDSIAWTRISEWGKPFNKLIQYIKQNYLESRGVIPYTPRKIRRAPRTGRPKGADYRRG